MNVSLPTALIVDDNPTNLRLLAFLLRRRGYEVTTAVNGAHALDAIREGRPDLVLVDLQLPGIDGLELTRRIKADPSLRDIVIVAVTAYAMRGDEERAIAAGCDAYVTKPINTRTLPAFLSTLIPGRKRSVG